MARLEGIPSRIAVGYAPGRLTGATVTVAGQGALAEYEVDARDAHAWPELYFQGLGWVPFEPTPSRGWSRITPPKARYPARPAPSTTTPTSYLPATRWQPRCQAPRPCPCPALARGATQGRRSCRGCWAWQDQHCCSSWPLRRGWSGWGSAPAGCAAPILRPRRPSPWRGPSSGTSARTLACRRDRLRRPGHIPPGSAARICWVNQAEWTTPHTRLSSPSRPTSNGTRTARQPPVPRVRSVRNLQPPGFPRSRGQCGPTSPVSDGCALTGCRRRSLPAGDGC